MRSLIVLGAAVSAGMVANVAVAPRPAHAVDAERVCAVINVGAYPDRVHVRCSGGSVNGVPQPLYFAVEADSPMAAQLVTLASQAFTLNKPLYLHYETSSQVNPSGCDKSDCRRVTSITLK